MSAAKTGLLHYKDALGKSVYAAKIAAIEDYKPVGAPHGSKRLHFAEPKKQSNLIGDWVLQHKPEIGGYFVAFDNSEGQTVCSHIQEKAFNDKYTRVA